MSGHEKIYPSENNPCPAHRLIHYWIPWERQAEMSFSLENLWSIYELEEQQRHWGRLGGNTSCAVHTTPYEPTNVQASRAAPQRLSAPSPQPRLQRWATQSLSTEHSRVFRLQFCMINSKRSDSRSKCSKPYLKTLILLKLELNERENVNAYLGHSSKL